MASIRGKNTKPELVFRKMLWVKGLRYRVHDSTVFGKPDISNKSKKLAVFIDGCFWHGCKKCFKEPTSNIEFWRRKIHANKNRRIKVKRRLRKEGWKIIEIWEHEIYNEQKKIQDIMTKMLKHGI